MKVKIKSILWTIIWLFEGIVVGFGAIMPGISGAALCVAFGMYFPLLETVSHPLNCLKRYWKMLAVFLTGAILGFMGLSGLANYLMTLSNELVTCAFVGLILGTFPELWRDAGKKGRSKGSYIALIAGFAAMLTFLILLKCFDGISIGENIWGYLLCGLLWGLSFIIPGLSSSTLIIFLGLYQPMLDGISRFDIKVILPLGVGVIICFLLLTKVVSAVYAKYYSVVSHIVIGVVLATTIMIIPVKEADSANLTAWGFVIICGAAMSYILTLVCSKLKDKSIQ